MSKLFLTAAWVLLASMLDAFALDFEPMPLDRMVRTADLAVAGTSEESSSGRITLKVSEMIFGPDIGNVVTIKRIKDWSGAEGPGIFRTGQRMVVFAARAKPTAGANAPSWRTIGFENEAVLPIEGDTVYFTGKMPGLERGTYDLDGVQLTAYRLDLADFVEAVRAHRECFGQTDANSAHAPSNVLCSEKEFEAYRNETTLGPSLIDQAMHE